MAQETHLCGNQGCLRCTPSVQNGFDALGESSPPQIDADLIISVLPIQHSRFIVDNPAKAM
jgi:hypothetical protein